MLPMTDHPSHGQNHQGSRLSFRIGEQVKDGRFLRAVELFGFLSGQVSNQDGVSVRKLVCFIRVQILLSEQGEVLGSWRIGEAVHSAGEPVDTGSFFFFRYESHLVSATQVFHLSHSPPIIAAASGHFKVSL